jgi:prepilin-type N-terminal cleavage/methylation domain-containing protein
LRHKNQQGFTLVEMVVAGAILSLVIGIGAPRAYSAYQSSLQMRAHTELTVIQVALERYAQDLGYYPNKLGNLVSEGYLRSGVTFIPPGKSKKIYYFYAVDDNTGKDTAKHYILAMPSGDPATKSNQLHHGGPLPSGKHPSQFVANAWVQYSGNTLQLYYEDDINPIGGAADVPASLVAYRFNCRTLDVAKCDVLAN